MVRASCALVVALAAVPSARADFKESYRGGMEAVDDGNWREVARLMRLAAAEQPREMEKVRLYGMRSDAYLPYYYLGVALYNLNDCEGALAAWRTSEMHAAVQRTPEYRSLAGLRRACEARARAAATPAPTATPAPGPGPAAGATLAQAIAAAEANVAEAGQHAASAAGLRADPASAAAHRQATELLARARMKLDSGRRAGSMADLEQAQDMAARAALQFETLVRGAAARRDAAKAERPFAPPAELLAAARAYFGGSYREAAALLAGVQYAAPRAAAQAALLRAAARHSLFVLSSGRDERLQQEAQADVAACRRHDPALTPDPRFFSPRFVEFFKSAR